jgi:hypothetical protein
MSNKPNHNKNKNRLKNVQVVNDTPYGVCVWKMPDGSVLGDGEGRILSLQGYMNHPTIEAKMLRAAKSYIGDEALEGKPHWIQQLTLALSTRLA